MKTRFNRAAATFAAATIAVTTATLSFAGAANAAPLNPGDPPAGTMTIAPTSGIGSTPFQLQFDDPAAPQFCPGNADSGYLVQAFITPLGADIAGFTWDGDGAPTNGPGFTTTLWRTDFTRMTNMPPASDNFQVNTLPQGDFEVFVPGEIPAGVYEFGVACTKSLLTEKYWTVPVTISANPSGGSAQISWVEGMPQAAPDAPTLNTVTPGTGTLTANFSSVTASPAVTGYTVTATDGTNTFTATGAASPITVTGLTNGTAYDVSVVATNAEGDSPASNVISGTPTAGAQPAPTNVTVVPGANAGELLASWTTPAGQAVSGYSLAVSTGGTPIAGSPFSVAAGTNSHLVTGLTAGTVYDFQVTATYADPSAVPTPSAVVSASPASADTLQQVIEVERPAGALILTQRCGVHGELPAEAVDAGFPGFPAVDLLAADTTDPSAPVLVSDGTTPDPEYPDYPFANPDVPTRCIVDLGTAELLTEGDLAGQYYAASGALNEITVVDTRQGDNGWTVTGSIPSLSSGAASDQTFSGDLVGWTPKVSDTSDPVGGSTYDQVVTAGAAVVPGTVGGLSAAAGQVLADAASGEGLGIAVLDARIKVLIPVENATGEYSGTLSLNAA